MRPPYGAFFASVGFAASFAAFRLIACAYCRVFSEFYLRQILWYALRLCIQSARFVLVVRIGFFSAEFLAENRRFARLVPMKSEIHCFLSMQPDFLPKIGLKSGFLGQKRLF